jgi:hypothetical protein
MLDNRVCRSLLLAMVILACVVLGIVIVLSTTAADLVLYTAFVQGMI